MDGFARTLLAGSLLFGVACEGNIATPEGLLPPGERPSAELCNDVDRDPGYVTVHRLNRVEFNNTVRDLLGDTSAPADRFPVDNESKEGFINNADVLTVGDLAVESFQAAAQELAEAALGRTAFQDQYLACSPGADCAREFVETFGLRAWRRPLEDAEIDRLVGIVALGEEDGSFEEGVGLAMRAMLLSPNFTFRPELHEGDGVRELNGYELASRLSYFLWATMPDDELFELAANGDLRRENVLRAQAERMIEDERFDAFLTEFAARWLTVTNLPSASPSPELFPTFDEPLREAMAAETRLFVDHIVKNNLPVSTLLQADFTFLNERLAEHYNIDGVTGDEMRLVPLSGSQRGGLLTQGALLTVTSQPNRTSLVKRGEYVLERFLCSPPPPPPDNVDALAEDPSSEEGENLTLRQRVERHRANAECATCHALMDPIGFALENFDAVGSWREDDNGEPIDSFGELPDGQTFTGAHELAEILVNDERFAACVGENLTTYALGRSLRAQDYCIVDDIVSRTEESELTLRNLLVEIVADDVFRNVGAAGGER
ncbi:MAG: DUF1592 domain-containing protein [Myxococcota bacterium]